jgi:peptide/nickel transport system substrate-binding protein
MKSGLAKRKLRNVLRGSLAVTIAAIAAASYQPAKAAETFVVAAVTTPKGFDGDVYVPGMVENVINVYEGLTDYSLKQGADGRMEVDATNLVPHLAESWRIEDGGKTVIFKLRNAKSFFGNELTADDVVFTHEKSLTQKRTGVFIRNVSSVESVEKISDKEVRFNLKGPNHVLLGALQIYVPSIYDSKTVKEHATGDDPFAKDWIANNTAGFGAYQVQSVRPGEGSVLVVNPNYFGPKPYFDRVIYREVPSPANRAALVKSGAAHWAEQVPIQAIPDLIKDPNVKVERVIGTGSASIMMNAGFEPFGDVRVRRAMILAADYEAINKTVFLGLGTKSHSFLATQMPGYKEIYDAKTDYAEAKKLLAEAGHPNGIEVTLEYSDLYWWEEPMVISLQESMKNAGITVIPKRIPSTELRLRAGPGKRTIPFHTAQTTPFVLDPSYQLFLGAHSGGSSNVANYQNPEFDKLVEAMTMEQDPDKRIKMIEEAQETLARDAIMIDTFYPGVYAVMNPCIEGWVWKPVPYTYFRTIRCEKKS